MRGRTLILAMGLGAAAIPAAGQMPGVPTPGVANFEVVVRVWPGSDRCSVFDRRVRCARVPGMLQGSLQIGRERPVYVAATSTDEEVMIRAAQLVTDVKAAGYTRAILVDPNQRPPLE
jgi:hypothetical protein